MPAWDDSLMMKTVRRGLVLLNGLGKNGRLDRQKSDSFGRITLECVNDADENSGFPISTAGVPSKGKVAFFTGAENSRFDLRVGT